MANGKKLGLGALLLMAGLGGMRSCDGFQEAHNNAKYKQQFIGNTTERAVTYVDQFRDRAKYDPVGSYGPPLLAGLGGYVVADAFRKKKKEEEE